jgi:hypothetical protein
MKHYTRMAVFDLRSNPHPLPSEGGAFLPHRRCSTAWLPPLDQEAHRLCVPASQRVCLYRDAAAPALVNYRTNLEASCL